MDRNIPSPPKAVRKNNEAEDSIFEAATSPILHINAENVSTIQHQPNAVIGLPTRKLPLEQPFAFDSNISFYSDKDMNIIWRLEFYLIKFNLIWRKNYNNIAKNINVL